MYVLLVQKRLRWSPPEGWVRAPVPAITASATASAVAGGGGGGIAGGGGGVTPLARSPSVSLPPSPATLSSSAAPTLVPDDFPLSELGRAVFVSALRQRKAAVAAAAAAAARARERMDDAGSGGGA